MLYKEIHSTNTVEKSKWNSKQCSSYPQEGRKKVIPVENERLMRVCVERGGSGVFSISTPGLFQSELRPFCSRKHSPSYCFGVHWGEDSERNLPSSSMELCLGSYGGLVNLCLWNALLQQAGLPLHLTGLLAKAWARLTFSIIRAHSWGRMVPLYSDYKTEKHCSVCDLYCWKIGIQMVWKGPGATLAKGRSKLDTFGAVP